MRTIQLRFAAVLILVLSAASFGVFYLHRFQTDRIADDLKAQVDAAVAAGQTDDAIRLAYVYLEFRDHDVGMLENLANWLAEKPGGRNHTRHVAALLDRAVQMEPTRNDLRRRLVAMNLQLGRWGECLDHLERLLTASPDDAELLAHLGVCQEAIAKPHDAARSFERSWKLNPKRADTAIDYAGLLYKQLQRPDDARAVFDAALRENPNHAELRICYARLMRELGQTAEASAAVAEAVRLAPDDVTTLTAAAEIAQALGRYSTARTYLAKARTLAPAKASLACTLAWLLVCEGKSAEAAAELEAVLKEKPDHADALTLLGDILALDGRIDSLVRVCDELDRVKKADPNRAWNADYLRARLLMKQQNYPAAVARLEELRAASAKRPPLARQANYLIAQCYEKLGDTPAVIDAFRRVIDSDPRSAHFRVEFARALARAGDAPAAAAELRTAVQRPDAPAASVIAAVDEIVHAARRTNANSVVKELEKAWEPVRGDAAQPLAPLAKTELLRLIGRRGEALKTVEQFLKAHPGKLEAIALRVRLIDEMNGPERAAAALSEAEKRYGVPGELRIARLRLVAGRPNVPAEVFRATGEGVDKLSPEDRGRVLATWARLADGELALEGWQKLRAARPDDTESRAVLLSDALRRGDEPTTRQLLDELAAVEGPNGRTARLFAVERLLHSGQPAEADRLAASLPADLAHDPVALFLRGRIDELQGRSGPAKANYNAAFDRGLLDLHPARLVPIALAGGEQIVLLTQSALMARLRLDADRAAIVPLLKQAPASVRPALAERLLIANATAAAPQLVWFGRALEELGVGRLAEVAYARATETAPLSDEAWAARVAYHAARNDARTVDELVVAARKSLPADRTSIVLVAAGKPADPSAAVRSTAESSRTRIEQHLKTGRITEAREALAALIAAPNTSGPDREWARRTLAINLTIEPSQASFRKSLELLDANPGNDDDQRAYALVYGAQRTAPLGDGRTCRAEARRRIAAVRDPKADDIVLTARLARADGDANAYQAAVRQLGSIAANDAAAATFLAEESLRAGAAIPNADTLTALASTRFDALALLAAGRALAGDGIGPVQLLDQHIRAATDPQERAARQVRCGHAAYHWLHALPLEQQPEAARQVRAAAVRWYRDGLGHDPLALLHLVTLLGEAGQLADALDLLNSGPVRSAFSGEARAAAYVTALRRGSPTPQQTQAVERLLAGMLRDKPDSATLQLTLADLYEQTDRRPQAEALYRAVLERDPNNLPAANNLAWTAVTNPEKIPFALKLIESTIERHGPLDDLLDTRGRLLVSAGRFEEGLRDLRESADAAPSAARFVQLAVVYQSAGRPRDAQAALEQARRFGLRPGDIPGHDAPVVRELAKF